MRGSHFPCPSAGIGLHVGSHPRPGTEPVRDSASGSREHALPLGGARSAHWCTKAQLGITSPSWDGASSDSSFGIPAAPWSPHLECATGTLGPGTGTLRGLRASRPAGAGFPHDGERLRGVAEDAQCPSGAGVQRQRISGPPRPRRQTCGAHSTTPTSVRGRMTEAHPLACEHLNPVS